MLFKCPFCPRTFSTRSACSQHISHCVPPDASSSSEESDFINDISEIALNDQNIEINESDQSMSISGGDQSMSISEGGDQSVSISEGGDQSMSISEGGDQSMSILEDSDRSNSNEDPVFEDILDDVLREPEVDMNAEVDMN